MPAIKILHISDIHLGSSFSHGRLNPETGLNTRLEDFTKCLNLCIDRAIAEPVDLILFGLELADFPPKCSYLVALASQCSKSASFSKSSKASPKSSNCSTGNWRTCSSMLADT
jgi:exonuclease SbcD